MDGLKRNIIALILMLLTAVSGWAARAWESVDRAPAAVDQALGQTDDVCVTSIADGYLYLSVRQRTSVKLFTILGQPVVQDVLSPGLYRIRLTTRGIYLLKIGTATRRITV